MPVAAAEREGFVVPLVIDGGGRWADGGQPVSVGVWLPPGAVRGPVAAGVSRIGTDEFSVSMELPAQAEPLGWWPDGSVEWLLADFVLPWPAVSCQLTVGGCQSPVEGVEADGRAAKPSLPTVNCQLSTQFEDGVIVETGSATFHVKRSGGPVVSCQSSVVSGDSGSTTSDRQLSTVNCQLTCRRGRVHQPQWDTLHVEAAGPVRATVVLTGRIGHHGWSASLPGGHHGLGTDGLHVEARLSFFAGSGLVRSEVTLHNPRRARHRGGLWDLGDRGSVLFREFSWRVSADRGQWSEVRCQLGEKSPGGTRSSAETTDHGPRTTDTPFTVYQDSSGGENWNGEIHVNREGRVPLRFRGWIAGNQLTADSSQLSVDAPAGGSLSTANGQPSTGSRAEPVVRVAGAAAGGGAVSVAVPGFWQEFPKAISVEGGCLRVGLFPREFGDLHELQGGERKTHTVWLDFAAAVSAGGGDAGSLAWVYEPAVVRQEAVDSWQLTVVSGGNGSRPNRRLSTESARLASPPRGVALERLDGLLAEALDGRDSLFARRERADEYGWRNFGEVFADHELQHYTGERPLVSHYNNQFDMVYGFLLNWLRTGERRWFELGDSLARHVMDIDIYHTRRDRAAYNGGLFWFTDHYLHAATATHRTYSRANASPGTPYGGGPSAQHNFTTGLLLYHFLTGSAASRAAVLELAEWVVAMDDGRRNVLGVVDDGPTGLATATADADYHGPGRAAGNSINALLDAWSLSGAARYREFAERLIRRCVHPADDVAALDLLDAEKRWSYTVFLSSLAKYLELKARAGQLDAMYAYARASLLAFARWMAEHERPYFERIERLEYPTETWPAQEFRKANVMRRAALHADEPLRTRLFDRGDELAERAWADLLRFETRTSARALAIVMVQGLWDCVLRDRDAAPLPPAALPSSRDFGPREVFVPQKARVRSRLRSVPGAAGLALGALNPGRWWRYWSMRSPGRTR